MAGRPPKNDPRIKNAMEVHKPNVGLTPANRQNPTTSGITEKDETTPASRSFLTSMAEYSLNMLITEPTSNQSNGTILEICIYLR